MVTSRTREIGIRMALGAQPRDVVRMVLRQGMTLALIGVAIGLTLAAGVSRALGSLLFGVGPADPLALGGSAAALFLIGLPARYAPARPATVGEAPEARRYEEKWDTPYLPGAADVEPRSTTGPGVFG